MITFNPSHPNAQNYLVEWIHKLSGAFSVRDLDFQKLDYKERFLMMTFLETLCRVGFIEPYGNTHGWYVKSESVLVELDFINAVSESVSIWLPFDLSDLVEIHGGNIIIIAGTPNSGKSALMYNIIKENRHEWDISLFNSESGAGELRKRLDKFDDITIDQWNFNAYQRSENFHQVVKRGPQHLNIIDFLQVHDDFYKVGGLLTQIHDILDGAIAIVGLQKNPGSDTGLGGYRMLEVTRLAIALEFGRVKVIKAKNFRDPMKNPNGLVKDFKLFDGYKIVSKENWREDI